MTTLLLCTEALGATGGVQRFTRNLMVALARRPAAGALHVIALLDGPHAADCQYLSGVARYRPCGGSKVRFVLEVIAALLRQPALVIFNHAHLAPLVLAARLLASTASTWVVLHGFEAWEKLAPLRLAGVQRCSHVIAVSAYTREQFLKHNRLPHDKVKILYHGLDPFWFPARATGSPSPTSVRWTGGAPYLLSVTRLEPAHGPYKGLDDTLRALRLLLRRGQLGDCRYVISGEGADQPRLAALAAAEGLSQRVIFTGRVSDAELQGLFAGCEFFVLPSQKEGFGLVFIEAMAYGKAVVASTAGACPEVVLHGETGALISPGDPAGLADMLRCLLADPSLRARWGEAGCQRLMQEFTFSAFADRVDLLLSSSHLQDPALRGAQP
jgi:glycosyltransferase involved in cell wall biosynthesis